MRRELDGDERRVRGGRGDGLDGAAKLAPKHAWHSPTLFAEASKGLAVKAPAKKEPTCQFVSATRSDAARMPAEQRFDKAARAGNSAKGLVHYTNRLQKARRRGNARKIAKFERKVQKYNRLAAAAVETSDL